MQRAAVTVGSAFHGQNAEHLLMEQAVAGHDLEGRGGQGRRNHPSIKLKIIIMV